MNLISVGKTILVLMISIGVSTTLFSPSPDNLFGFAILLLGLYGYYCFDKVRDSKKRSKGE